MKKILRSAFLVSAAVFSLSEAPAQITASIARTDTMNLMALSLEDLMSISVVTASKSKENIKDAPAVISVITAREIEAYGAMTLFEVLDRATGIYMLSSYISPKNQVAMRGQNTDGGNKNVLFLLDGRPIRESSNAGTVSSMLSAFPLSRIERLEIVRGPGSVLYGSKAFTGVINIITKKGEGQELVNAKVNYGSFNTVQGTVSGGRKIGEVEVAAGVSYLDSKGWDFTARGANDFIRNKANTADSIWLDPKTIKAYEKSMGADASIQYKGFRLATNYSDTRQTGISRTGWWRGNPNPMAPGPIEFETHIQRVITDLNYQKEISSHYSTSISLTHNYFKAKLGRPALQNDLDDHLSNDVILEWTHFIKPVEKLNIVLGGLAEKQMGRSYAYDRQAADNPLGFISYNVLNTQLPLNPTPFLIVPNYNQTNWSTYLQADYKLTNFLKMIVGAQTNKIPGLHLDVVPRLGSVITFNESWGAKVLYGQAYRAPNAQEKGFRIFPVLFGNPNLKPEKIGTFETQVYYAKSKGEISLTYYNSTHQSVIKNSTLSDSLLVINGLSVLMPINQGTIKSQGIELEGKAYLSTTLSVSGSATYQTMENQYGKKDITGVPKVMAKIGITYNAPFGLSVGVFNSYFGKGGDISTPTTRNLNPAVKAYNYMTTNVSYKLNQLIGGKKTPDLILGVYVQNLLDESIYYPESLRKNMNSIPGRPGRAFQVSLAMKL